MTAPAYTHGELSAAILDALDAGPAPVADIARMVGRTVSATRRILIRLDDDGRVEHTVEAGVVVWRVAR